MKKEFEKEQNDNWIEDAFLDMPDMEDDEKFRQWLEEEYIREADAIEEALLADQKFEDHQDLAEKLSVSRESFYQRAREEGLLDEAADEENGKDSATEVSDEELGTDEPEKSEIEMPESETPEPEILEPEMSAFENSGKKVLEFRKAAENTDKVVSSEEKSSGKKKHSYVRWGKIAGIAGVCLLCVFAASMSSEANRKYLVNSVRILSGNDSKVLVDNTDDNERASTEESDAIADIEEKLDVKIPEFYYRPQGIKFLKYKINEDAFIAYIKYSLNDNGILFYIDKQRENRTSNISSISGKEEIVDVISKDWGDIVVKKVLDRTDENLTYTASWLYEETSYTISGKVKLEELKKMIEEMKF